MPKPRGMGTLTKPKGGGMHGAWVGPKLSVDAEITSLGREVPKVRWVVWPCYNCPDGLQWGLQGIIREDSTTGGGDPSACWHVDRKGKRPLGKTLKTEYQGETYPESPQAVINGAPSENCPEESSTQAQTRGRGERVTTDEATEGDVPQAGNAASAPPGGSTTTGGRVHIPNPSKMGRVILVNFGALRNAAGTHQKEMLEKVHEWAQKWGMACGIDKCKAMVVFGDQDSLKLEELLIGEDRIGVCESYRYLGLEVDSKLSVERMIKERAAAGRKSIVWHEALFEVIGMHDQSKQQPLQRVVLEGIKWMVGKSVNSTIVGSGGKVELGASHKEVDFETRSSVSELGAPSSSKIEGLESLVSKLRSSAAANDNRSRLALLLGGEIGGRLSGGPSGSNTTFEPTPERVGLAFHQGTQWSREFPGSSGPRVRVLGRCAFGIELKLCLGVLWRDVVKWARVRDSWSEGSVRFDVVVVKAGKARIVLDRLKKRKGWVVREHRFRISLWGIKLVSLVVFISHNIFIERSEKVVRRVVGAVQDLSSKFRGAPLVILGDWNMSLKSIEQWIGRCRGMQVLRMAGDRWSFQFAKGKPISAIDHIVVNQHATDLLGSGRVLRRIDGLDHWPVQTSFRQVSFLQEGEGGGEEAGRSLVFQRAKINEIRDEIRLSNRWEPLERLDCSLEEGVESGVKSLVDISLSVASSVGVVGDVGSRRPRSGFRVKGKLWSFQRSLKRPLRKSVLEKVGKLFKKLAEALCKGVGRCGGEKLEPRGLVGSGRSGASRVDKDQWVDFVERILVSIPKKGDLTLHDNYRGISLNLVLLEILTSVIIKRIDAELDDRKNIKWWKATYVAFIDFKKAYDMVPHEALMKKLRAAGVAGKALDFFKNLYSSTLVKVRFEDLVSPPTPVQRGVRQGCPTSPSLFNIFINDIMDGLKVKEMLKRVHEWAQRWGMACGIDKCKAMVVFGDQDSLKLEELLIGEDRIGVCESYRYLGLEVDSKLYIERMVKERVAIGIKVLFGMRHFLVDKRIPMWAKVLAFKALVHPCLTCGAEVIGMHDQNIQQPLNRVVVEGIKWMVGKSVNSTTVGATVLHRELNVCPIAAFNAGQRARGFFKYRGLKTWVADLVNFPSAYRVGEKWSWVHHTKKWIAKNAPRCQNQGLLVREVAWEAWEFKHSTEALKFYKEFKLEGSREFFKRAMRYENVTPEKVCLLILARVWGYLLVKRAVRLGLVDHRIGVRCPLCNEEGGDSLFHVLVKCPSLVHIRSRIEGLESLVSRLWLTNAANDDKSRLTLLFGGEVGGRLCNWLWGRSHWRGTAGFVHVVNLLTEVIPVYNQALRDWEVQGDGSQLSIAEGPSRSDTTFEPTPERVGTAFHQGTQWSSFVSGQLGWVYLILWRIPRVTETKSESCWPVRILQAMLEHGSPISSGRVFEP
eukprot:Gb_41497 [translate_table: standard]